MSLLGQIKNKCVSGNGSENLGRVGHISYFSDFLLCILKGISPFIIHKINFFSRKPEKKVEVSPVNLGRVGLL